MHFVALLLLMLPASPPALRDRFPEAVPSHVFLVVDTETGEVVRADDEAAAEREAFPAGESWRVLLALAGLEEGLLDSEEGVPCDSTCWGRGTHGTPDLAQGLAFSCDAWFRRARELVPPEAVVRQGKRIGFRPPAAESLGPDRERPGSAWRVTAREWTDFWRGAQRGALGLRTAAASTVMVAGGLSVASPRGVARALHDPAHRVRVIVGGDEEGNWVTGTLQRRGPIRWVFALYVRGGSPALATARAALLLEETLDAYEQATSERGGEPLAPFDEDR